MNRAEVHPLLRSRKRQLAERFGVRSLALFGSAARNEARTDSDIDVLVAFDGPATSTRYFGPQFAPEDLLGSQVDPVTEKALRPKLRALVENEAIAV